MRDTFNAPLLRDSIALEEAIAGLAPGDWVKGKAGQIFEVTHIQYGRACGSNLMIKTSDIREVRKRTAPVRDDAGEHRAPSRGASSTLSSTGEV